MFYTNEKYFAERFDETYRPFAFKGETSEEYAKWKTVFRAKLKELLGLSKMKPCSLEPVSEGIDTLEGFTREKVIINTEEGIKMPLYVLKPEGKGPFPAIIAAHGHGGGGKDPLAGIDGGHEAIKEAIPHYNYTYGVSLVKRGFMVFCPDARGFGERREKYWQDDGNVTNSSCAYLNAMAYPLGLNVTGMWTWDLMRLLDYIETRPEADSERLNCAGLSGGGLQTLWLGAMDERVKNVIISGYFYGYKQAILEMHHCSCNYVPGLWENADIGDVGALIADRGIFIETGDKDPLNGRDGVVNVYPQVEILRKAAELLGNAGGIGHHVFEGEHRWNGEKSIPWIAGRNGI